MATAASGRKAREPRQGSTTQVIQLDSGDITGRLDEYVLKVLPQDLVYTLRAVAYQELGQQLGVGNVPSSILVDGRSVAARGIEQATRKVSLRFADTNMMLKAANEAFMALQRVTRIESPPKNSIVARLHFHLWLNGRDLGVMPAALSKLTQGALDAKSTLRIVGPLVPYGRKLYWRPIGRSSNFIYATERTNTATGASRLVYGSKYAPRFKPYSQRTLKRIANQFDGDKAKRLAELQSKRPGTAEAMHQIVKRVLRKNSLFKGLYISDGWVSFPPAKGWGKKSRDDRVPSISITLAKKGAVRLI